MTASGKPLAGLRILDLSRVLACPFATMIMAELGADVIKVEQPGTGDETRGFEPFFNGVSAYYMAFNRSKESITVNLRNPEGQKIVHDLAAKSDVLIENFPVGTLKRYGLDYDSLKAEAPHLVYLSCTGFGQTGPYAAHKGYDTVFMAMGGIMSLTGERGRGPVKPGLPVADLTSGLWAAVALLAALQGRATTGQGSYIDFSMLDGQVSLLTLAAARFFALGEVPARIGTEHPGRVPSASFLCADGKWLHITCSDQHWLPLCRTLDLADWGGQVELLKNRGRLDRRDEVMAKLSDAIAQRERDTLCRLLETADVPVGPVNSVDEVLSDPHILARGLIQSFDYPSAGRFPALAVPFKFAGFEDPEVRRPPLLGEHTETVLSRELGIGGDRLRQLREQGVI